MPFAGLFLIILGAYFIDSAIKNRGPVRTLENIVKNPAAVRTALKSGSGFNTSSATPSDSYTMTGVAAGMISFARAQIGKPYRWGATGPDAYDCSGLVYAAAKAVGIKIPRTTAGQILIGNGVAKSDLQPGDLVFPDAGHVQIYTGGGNVVEAPRAGKNVREVPMWGFFAARRITAQPVDKHNGTVNSVVKGG